MKFDRGTRPIAPAPTEIDVAAAYRVAGQLEAAAELIGRAVSDHLARLGFGGAVAGRAHAARGDALRGELERLAAAVSQWWQASVEVAGNVRSSADRYAEAEAYATQRIA
ncbi:MULTISPECIES: type VII secretion target [unclassified Mycobacterium]|uniref:type VII secretion target n=1 Tax=unclassified Mycobacterium TaxID=2642494 RepID=UPI0008007290|nr:MULTISPECIES: type VII secretion target [unclassified Mycobacterium]OBG79081.1 hypothetical protein A5700_15290 [Mycobacterium sp. E1214]OBH30050.1 hypothetical protein A5693_01825 [Mycobacterium sp. E1319]